MDGPAFDELARAVAGTRTRRSALRALAGAALAGALAADGAAARCFKAGNRCRHDWQCCSGKCREGECARCRNGRTACGGACVDTGTSLAHCGGCDRPCDGACVGGKCVACDEDGDCPAPTGGSATCRPDGLCERTCDNAAFHVCGDAPGACQACCEDGHCADGQACMAGECACTADSCSSGCCDGTTCKRGDPSTVCGEGRFCDPARGACCAGVGVACAANADCCLNDGSAFTCPADLGHCRLCRLPGEDCTFGGTCCSGRCEGGKCACLPPGNACVTTYACCGAKSGRASCGRLGTCCLEYSEECVSGFDCCSRVCHFGRCAPGE